jgi:uncharacterized protein
MKYLLVLVVVVGLLWWLLGGRSRRTASRPPPKPGLEGMVRCAHCGVHLPRSEALLTRGLPYCSPAHRDAGPSDT